ncbi:MAG: amidohydrolase, partial [Alphaproteobacteria bacterium]|nr:amidohydrolase [Alphaproteobacteria bacterium]
MDLILKNAVLAGGDGRTLDVGIADGRIKAIEAGLAAEGETLDLNGRLLSPGFIETHIHLDKACIMERCRSEKGDLAEAI